MEDNIGPIDLSMEGSLAKKFKLQEVEEGHDLSFRRAPTIPCSLTEFDYLLPLVYNSCPWATTDVYRQTDHS